MHFISGLPETPCGAGSTLRATERLRRELPKLLGDLKVTSLLDAPCGDGNWMAEIDLGGIEYIGVDYIEAHLEAARERSPDRLFLKRNIVTDALPRAEAILSRDFLQHLTFENALFSIENFRNTGARWLLATSFDNDENVDINRDGGFRPVNLVVRPFDMPPPEYAIEDGKGRILGVWSLT